MQLKPQDFLVALKLVAWGDQRWTYARLAQELGLSASEVHGAVKRGLLAGLLLQNRVALPQPVEGASAAALSVQEPAGIYRVTRKRVRRPAQPPDDVAAASDNPVRPHARVIMVHPDPDQLGALWRADPGLVADPCRVVAALADLPAPTTCWSDWRARLRASYDDWQTPRPTPGKCSTSQTSSFPSRRPM